MNIRTLDPARADTDHVPTLPSLPGARAAAVSVPELKRTSSVRVLVVDDHAFFPLGLRPQSAQQGEPVAATTYATISRRSGNRASSPRGSAGT